MIQGEPPEEGAEVFVLIPDESTFSVNAENEAALLEAITEADRGERVDIQDVLNNFKDSH